MHVGRAMFQLAREQGASSIFVVGIGKNVGKTVTMRAIYDAAYAQQRCTGVASVGRDGEAFDVGDNERKPRLFLRHGTIVATARNTLPRSPAVEFLASSTLSTAAGAIVYVRVAAGAHYELVGPPTASGIRDVVAALRDRCDAVIVDGAIDRVAALAGMPGAIVVAAGASAAGTIAEASEAVAALVQRLRTPRYDARAEALHLEGALTPMRASELIAVRESRQIVVRDPTQIALTGKAASNAFARLRIRCKRPLRVIAVTVAAIGRERSFEPRSFANAVAGATGLPTFDVYAGARAG
ncbi:MAG: hypothetical protein JOZ01_01975 [Candidatus Eremiobacteraeota bacterium]|nr:hypothetical protein [Candidatus Eremiobacteraeota bacterium]